MSKKLRKAILILSAIAIVIFLLFGLISLSADLGIPGLIQCITVIIVTYCSLSTITRFLMLPKATQQEATQQEVPKKETPQQ